MRILFLSDFCPWPLDNGYRQRVYQLVRSLSQRHAVTLATVMPDEMRDRAFPPAEHCVDLIPLADADCAFRFTRTLERWAPARDRLATLISSPLPNVVRRWHSAGIAATLEKLYRGRTYDVVWAERPFIAELARSAGFRRIVIDLPDVETVLFSRSLAHGGLYPSKPLHWLELAKLYAYDQTLPLRFWRLVVCKEADRQFYRLRRSNVVTLPNGVEDHPPSLPVADTTAPQVMFLGALNYESNIDAVRLLADSIVPLIRREHPGARLVIIGRDPVPTILDLHDGNSCSVLSDVQDLTPHFDAASLFVAPIRLGSGTRLKVLEAMVRQKAVVATSVAAEGLDVRPGVDLEVADSPQAFAAACCALLRDSDRRGHLAASGRTRVLDRYLWSHLTRRAEAVISDTPQDVLLTQSTSNDPTVDRQEAS